MNCRECQQNLAAFLDREPASARAARLQEHLEHCTACAALYRELRQLDQVVSQAPELEPSPELWAKVQARLEATPPAVGTRPRGGWADWITRRGPHVPGVRLRWLGAGALLAAMTLSAAAGLYQQKMYRTQRQLLAQIDGAQREIVGAGDRNPFSAVVSKNPDENPFGRELRDESNPFKQP